MTNAFRNFHLGKCLQGAALASLMFSALLVIKSLGDFSHTGPTIRSEIAEHFMPYSLLSIAKLGLGAFAIALLLAVAAVLVFAALRPGQRSPGYLAGFIVGGIGIGIGSVYQLAHVLLYAPSTILASWNYAPSRLVAVWPFFNPTNLLIAKIILLSLPALAIIVLLRRYLRQSQYAAAACLGIFGLAVSTLLAWNHLLLEPNTRKFAYAAADTMRPNIVMIGSDTLRADRMGAADYERDLTPFIDKLTAQGTYFLQAYSPIGRTAPAITSILTGLWPDTHGIRDNFVRDEQKQLDMPALPALLRKHGYRTAAIGDWAASDLGKIDFGFEHVRVSPDQWNFKYLLSQGPKDLRLFVSLFAGNEFGRIFLPQLYYIAGRPLTSEKGRYARAQLNRLAAGPDPFFLMLFVATNHGPFGSEYPYYTLFSGPDYAGDSKFGITGVTSPEEVAQRQAEGREAFDVEQIIDLYDGATRHFDDEVRRVVEHLHQIGIADNTIIVIFSDHGTDLFERDTWGQGNIVGVHDYSTHVPLLIVDPRRAATSPVPHLVRLVDLAPTLADLAGLSTKGFEGASLVPYMDASGTNLNLASYNESGALLAHIHGMEEGRLRAPPLLELLEVPDKASGTISISDEGEAQVEAARQKAIRTDRWIGIETPLEHESRYALFDLLGDAGDAHDIAMERPDILACFQDAFAAENGLERRLQTLSECLAQTDVSHAISLQARDSNMKTPVQ